MKDGILIHKSYYDILPISFIIKGVHNFERNAMPGVRNTIKEISDGKKATKLSIPSPFPKINQHDIKSEDDLIYV
jgi:hypothetical protein